MQKNDADREARLRELASKLFFTLKNQGSQWACSKQHHPFGLSPARTHGR